MRWLIPFLISLSVGAQDWHANSVWAYPVPVKTVEGVVTLPIPTSHDRVSLVGFLTTTNDAALLGDLRGGTVSATAEIVTENNPIFWWGNDCHSGIRFPNVRLYFTTTSEVYTLDHANANEVEYWWARDAFAQVQAGTFTLTAPLDPARWSDSQGHNGDDPKYTAGFLSAASRVAQIGFSFGGGCFYDAGVGIYNPDDPSTSATLFVRDYRIIRPSLRIAKSPGGIELSVSDSVQPCSIQYSENLHDWADLPGMIDHPASTRFYRLKPGA